MHVLQASGDFGSGGQVQLGCRGNGSWTATNSSINAIEVESLATAAVAG